MCGIIGVYQLDGTPADAGAVAAARERLAHRGPDDAGLWAEGPVAFGFRRLSILDLERGAQPMRTEDGRLTVVYNGEIYNHPGLRRELESAGARFRTRSDTETLLKLHERLGDDAVRRLEGMFAFALWDAGKRELVLARDPIGVKPLYYHFDGRRLVFASELKALAALLPDLSLDPQGIVDYLAYGFVHAPRTVLDGALKLPAGHRLKLNARGLKVERYWEPPPAPRRPGRGFDLYQAERETERLLAEAVRGQLLSDVPVGAFLSGGLDSSLVAAFMARASDRPVKTFSIGFSGARAGIDESAHARAVARHIGADHQELILPADVLGRVEDLLKGLDEPIGDSAILPTYLLARFARKSVKVVLTGEGADELFAGYNRYKAAYLSERVGRLPPPLKRLAAAVARRAGKGPLFSRLPHAGLEDWARATAHTEPDRFLPVLSPALREAAGRADPLDWIKAFEEPHGLRQAMSLDFQTVLCECLLMKVDKTTMRASLEARVPYLDRRLVEHALGLPDAARIRGLKGKYILRRIAARYLPRRIVWRRKHGFVVPWEEWVRAPRNSAVDDLLASGTLSDVFDLDRLRWMRRDLRSGSGAADAGLFFRIAVLGLWIENLRKDLRPCSTA